jgi:hypothetical protein
MYNYLYVFIFLLLLYASLYYIFYDELILYQVEATHFDFNLLLKKQPIIIQDIFIPVDDILVDWFSYNIIDRDVFIPNIFGWNRNHYKYFLIYADTEDSVEITLGNPLTKQENNAPYYNQTLTTILLNKKKILIIPFKWFYHINIIAGNPRFFGIHDYITYGLSFGVR